MIVWKNIRRRLWFHFTPMTVVIITRSSLSGYLVAQAAARPEGGNDTRLVECVAEAYGELTGLERRFTLTYDMTDYHTFREIDLNTPAAILEMGFMLADRELLTNRQDIVSQAVTEGVLCYLEPERPQPTITPLANGT